MQINTARNDQIDFLRFIGLSLIIFAHVSPPQALFQLRNFDVLLMVLVSALSFLASFKPIINYPHYIWSRCKRLIAPVWIFLTLYFISLFVIAPTSADLSPKTIISSYALLDGIGYVWIIRVFMLVALAAPFIYACHAKINSNTKYLTILFLIYTAYEICLFYTSDFIHDGMMKHMADIIYYIIPYSLLFAYGLRMPQISTRHHIAILITSLLIFCLMAGYFCYTTGGGTIMQTQNYKYPPSLYYLSFALVGCQFTWLVKNKVWDIIRLLPPIKKLILFIAQNSLWIYLWHIPFIKFIHLNYIEKYIFVYGVATLIVTAQYYVVTRLLIPYFKNQTVQKNLKIIFTG